MKVIRSLNDIEWLKVNNHVPKELVKEIEQDFLNFYEASNTEIDVLSYTLESHEAFLLLEAGDDVLEILENPIMLEFVEKSKDGLIEYYRMAKRIEHEFQLIYSLVGIHDEKAENFLKEQAEWNEGIGDF